MTGRLSSGYARGMLTLSDLDALEKMVRLQDSRGEMLALPQDDIAPLLALAREALLARDARPMLDGWRDGLERERNEAVKAHADLFALVQRLGPEHDGAIEALRELSYAAHQVHKGFEAFRSWESGKRGMGDNITIESMGRFKSLSCWLAVGRALERAEPVLEAAYAKALEVTKR